MNKVWNVIGIIAAGICMVAFTVDKVFQWKANSKLLDYFKKTDRLVDKGIIVMEKYIDEEF